MPKRSPRFFPRKRANSFAPPRAITSRRSSLPTVRAQCIWPITRAATSPWWTSTSAAALARSPSSRAARWSIPAPWKSARGLSPWTKTARSTVSKTPLSKLQKSPAFRTWRWAPRWRTMRKTDFRKSCAIRFFKSWSGARSHRRWKTFCLHPTSISAIRFMP